MISGVSELIDNVHYIKLIRPLFCLKCILLLKYNLTLGSKVSITTTLI